jgi:hypothetical protein
MKNMTGTNISGITGNIYLTEKLAPPHHGIDGEDSTSRYVRNARIIAAASARYFLYIRTNPGKNRNNTG